MNKVPDNYDAYLGGIQIVRDLTGLPIEAMTEVEFMEACERTGYVHRSVIDMDVFEEAFRA